MVGVNKATHQYWLSPGFRSIRRYGFTRARIALAPVTLLEATLIKQGLRFIEYHARSIVSFEVSKDVEDLVQMFPSRRCEE